MLYRKSKLDYLTLITEVIFVTIKAEDVYILVGEVGFKRSNERGFSFCVIVNHGVLNGIYYLRVVEKVIYYIFLQVDEVTLLFGIKNLS